jgi:hypothetical protein
MVMCDLKTEVCGARPPAAAPVQVQLVTGDVSAVIKEPVDFVYLNAHRDFCSVSACGQQDRRHVWPQDGEGWGVTYLACCTLHHHDVQDPGMLS